jgi:aldehyde dehydrogenase (NAD+)
MLHVNHGTFPDENMPFGGWKASGVGAPRVGQDAEQLFTRIQALYEETATVGKLPEPGSRPDVPALHI